ncbi:proline-rich protein 12-like, partial [Frankliniella occidentalis]|uniref:Proline-rich protein 12-like n=1 Tax=Frankliniella occidentalis TaxID=133901 RepID=A0A9C6XUT3_FRAOC
MSQHVGGEKIQEASSPPPASRPTSASPPPPPVAEEVPNITFTFFEAKEANKTNGEVEVADEATPDEEWEDEPQKEREVTETVVASPQRISVAMTSDGDDEFVDARGTSSDSDSPSPSRASRPVSAARPASAPSAQDEEPEYVCVERRSATSPDRGETPSATVNPIYRSPSYSHAVEEGLYSCPRPQGAPPPPPQGSPPAPPSSAPPPVPEPDWTSTDSGSNVMTSEYSTYYVLPTGEPTSLDGAAGANGAAPSRDYEELEYCSLRASQRARRPKSMAAGVPGEPAAPRPRVQRVRSRLGRAWRSVRGWWEDERARLGDTLMRHVHAQAVGAFDRPQSPGGTAKASAAQSCDHLDGD